MAGAGKGVFNFDKIEDWANLRARAIDAFDGELPNRHTEQLIIEAYEAHPEAVRKAIAQIATDFSKGTISTGWGVTKSRAERILVPPSNPKASTGIDREKRIARAEQWIRAAGLHFNSESELVDELFGDRGQLRNHPDLKTHMLELWATVRPEGEAIEAEAIERAEKWKTWHTQQQRKEPPSHAGTATSTGSASSSPSPSPPPSSPGSSSPKRSEPEPADHLPF